MHFEEPLLASITAAITIFLDTHVRPQQSPRVGHSVAYNRLK